MHLHPLPISYPFFYALDTVYGVWRAAARFCSARRCPRPGLPVGSRKGTWTLCSSRRRGGVLNLSYHVLLFGGSSNPLHFASVPPIRRSFLKFATRNTGYRSRREALAALASASTSSSPCLHASFLARSGRQSTPASVSVRAVYRVSTIFERSQDDRFRLCTMVKS